MTSYEKQKPSVEGILNSDNLSLYIVSITSTVKEFGIFLSNWENLFDSKDVLKSYVTPIFTNLSSLISFL